MLAATLLMGGCSTAKPWINAPLAEGEVVHYDGLRQIGDPSRSADLLVVASFSGGGSRAAALAHAALQELDRIPLRMDGQETTLASEIDVVTGVSGGSVAAAYVSMHGVPAFIDDFGPAFLDVDFGAQIFRRIVGPGSWYRLGSSYVGRGNLLADAFNDRLFHGETFGSLASRTGRPYLIVGATDIATGAEFDFASDQFGRLCSSIDAVPLAFAVAASSSVPLVFTPLTLANHAPECRTREQPAPAVAQSETSPRTQLVLDELDQYADPDKRFIHLVDGGVSDNLGVRRVVDYVAQTGGIEHVLQMLQSPDGRIARHIVFINVGSERRGGSSLDDEAGTASTLQMVQALANGGVGRASRATELAFADAVRSWRATLHALGPPYSLVDVYSIQIDISSEPDAQLRDRARAIPTAFVISQEDRAVLASVARSSVETSTELARLRAAVVATKR
jgi:NTE family protein